MSIIRRCAAAAAAIIIAAALAACGAPASSNASSASPFRIAVFVPGVVQGSPTYEMLMAGVESARAQAVAAGKAVEVSVVEGGYNQGDWHKGVAALAGDGYQLIVSSNPSLPAIAAEVSKSFPEQKFLIMDGTLSGNKSIKTIAFDQYQQGYLNGYYAGLVSTTSTFMRSNPELRVGLLAGQEYPTMNDEIRTGYLDGAKAVNPAFTLDFRVLGNWFDAAKADGLARGMIADKCDVILAIAGGGNQGVVSAAHEAGAYVMWFDSPGYVANSDVVIGATVVDQASATAKATLAAIDGTLDYGTPDKLGIKEGAVGFAFDHPDFPKSVPAAIVAAEKGLIDRVRSGAMEIAPRP